MKLLEALEIIRTAEQRGEAPVDVSLICGFTALHLQTFLNAHLQALLPGRTIKVNTGLYADCLGSIESFGSNQTHKGALVLEWADLDLRLGYRNLGGWSVDSLEDIVKTAGVRLESYHKAISDATQRADLVVSLPTLPLPPAFHTPGWQMSRYEALIRESVQSFISRIVLLRGVTVVNPQHLDLYSPHQARLDLKGEFKNGFPYQTAHADILAEQLARLIFPPQPKKGIITDLDDTLWKGILGEDGPHGISWDLDNHSQAHGLYQQVLSSLGSAGTLIAVASKNDPLVAQEALHNSNMLLSGAQIFPIEASWGTKSEAVTRILHAWNISADSVVFVDDTPLELAEVKAIHPDIYTLQFPKHDDQAIYATLVHLRELCGKQEVSEDDALRLSSLRRSAGTTDSIVVEGPDTESFLLRAEAEISIVSRKSPFDPRALELVNKTNQFNLNGRRFLESEWYRHLESPETFLMIVKYKDKYGPLGKIAVLTGHVQGDCAVVDTWVMSCRAFARRIEYRCLERVFQKFNVADVQLEFERTPKNSPLQDCLQSLASRDPYEKMLLTRQTFLENCPPMYHTVIEADAE